MIMMMMVMVGDDMLLLCTARSCPAPRMLYSECITSCPRTCSNAYGVSASSCDNGQRCYAGCLCPPDTVLSTTHDEDDRHHFVHNSPSTWGAAGGKQSTSNLLCVPVERCPCRYQGRRYPPGSVVRVNCNSWYAYSSLFTI